MRWPVIALMTTRSLDLAPLRVDHAVEMVEVLAADSLYIAIGGSPPVRADLDRRYAAQVAGDPEGRQWWLNWVIRHRARGELVGFVQATVERNDGSAWADVAWVVGEPFQGRGVATEAAQAMTNWLSAQGVHNVAAYIHPSNAASQTVASRIGMHPTSVVVDGETLWSARG